MSRDWTREEFGITDNTPVVDIDSLERKCERLQKQLDIAVKALKQYIEAKDMYLKAQDGTIIRLVNTKFYVAEKALKEIEELNEIHKQE